jgi:hypothetical protein
MQVTCIPRRPHFSPQSSPVSARSLLLDGFGHSVQGRIGMSKKIMQRIHQSPGQRSQHRRSRRWQRRARIAGPFLGIPLLFATLALSVDLIESQPAPAKPRLNRPFPAALTENRQNKPNALHASAPTASVIASLNQSPRSITQFNTPVSKIDLPFDGDNTTTSAQGSGSRRPSVPLPLMPPYTLSESR